MSGEAYDLLCRMIGIPSVSCDEEKVADMIEDYLSGKNAGRVYRFVNNIAVIPENYDPEKPTLMLNSHIDTVKPAPSYTFDPFTPLRRDGKIMGLGSNDAGASVVSLVMTFLALHNESFPFNLILALSAEEEVGGENGMRLLLPSLKEIDITIDIAIVGEPTGMQPAIAERGLIVLDCVTHGVTGHAARNEGVNALYLAMEDITRLREFRFPKVSEVLGPVKVSVTQISAGRQHNVVPDECRWVVDIRTTDAYTNEETAALLAGAMSDKTESKPRSTRVRASVISMNHPLVIAAESLGLIPFVSPTTSDMSLMWDFPSLKIGPGESSRSHSADEFIKEEEISEGIDKYIKLIKELAAILRKN